MTKDHTPGARELNPNHATTEFMRNEWVKIVALLMLRDGVTRTTITPEVVARHTAATAPPLVVAIEINDDEGIILRLVSLDEAAELAKREGGLPV